MRKESHFKRYVFYVFNMLYACRCKFVYVFNYVAARRVLRQRDR